MLALLPTLLPLLLMLFVNVDSTKGDGDMRHLNRFSTISLVIAGYLMLLIIWENIFPVKYFLQVITLVILLVLLATPMYVALTAHLESLATSSQPSDPERTNLIEDVDSSYSEGKRSRESEEKLYVMHVQNQGSSSFERCLSRRGENSDVLDAFRSCDFWLLFVAMSCGMGSGLATVNNISQIGASLGYSKISISTMVSLWSIWNFLGRFGAGYISDYFMISRGTARPFFIAATLGAMTIGHVVISSGFPGALYVGSVLVGVCYGCQWSLMPTITSELFGVMNMGTLFNTISIASPLGSYVLSVRVVGYIYDMETAASDSSTCVGTRCFRISFLIMASVSFFGSIVAAALFFRTRKFYQQVIVSRLRHTSLQL